MTAAVETLRQAAALIREREMAPWIREVAVLLDHVVAMNEDGGPLIMTSEKLAHAIAVAYLAGEQP